MTDPSPLLDDVYAATIDAMAEALREIHDMSEFGDDWRSCSTTVRTVNDRARAALAQLDNEEGQ